jgi:hypothetical protein
VLPVIFVCFVAPDGTEPPCDTAAANGKVWRREPDETEEAFRSRVAAEARRRSRAVGWWDFWSNRRSVAGCRDD